MKFFEQFVQTMDLL